MEGLKVKQFQQMFLAQLKLTLREKQAWFWGIFFPVILMSIFMVIFAGGSNEEFQSSVAIVKPSQNETSDMMLAQLQQIPNMDIKSEQPVSLENATGVGRRTRSRCRHCLAKFSAVYIHRTDRQ